MSQAAPVPGALEPTIRTYGIPVQPRGAREYPTTNTGVGVSAAHPQESVTAQSCNKRSAHLEVRHSTPCQELCTSCILAPWQQYMLLSLV